jgi:4-alpha-glucanotransferase
MAVIPGPAAGPDGTGRFTRGSGILLHPTSLPGPWGIGDVGPEAHRFVDFVAEAGCALWQVLPLGPTGYGDSPYQCFSAFAGNPYLVSPDLLLEDGLVTREDLATPGFPEAAVDFGAVIPWKLAMLRRAYERFEAGGLPALRDAFARFRVEQRRWLDDYALFMAIKHSEGGRAWCDWPEPLRRREPAALEEAAARLADEVRREAFSQFLFFRQWSALRAHAAGRGVRIIGDVPIFVAYDSADVWAHPGLFFLDDAGRPTVVAGVPPDYFSETGQLWGNPLYRWSVHRAEGYAWWIERLAAVLAMVDIVRLDHFRGFAAYWEVPAGDATAERGRWVEGPGADFFRMVRKRLGELPLIAEDLGKITPDVLELRDTFELPGMVILQFAWWGTQSAYLPHRHRVHSVVYTGTHDNDTSRGWYASAPEHERDLLRRYLGRDGSDPATDLIRAAWASVAVFALAPMQDLLGLGGEARMNLPGRESGNWGWRIAPGAAGEGQALRLRELNRLYGRLAAPAPAAGADATT